MEYKKCPYCGEEQLYDRIWGFVKCEAVADDGISLCPKIRELLDNIPKTFESDEEE